MSKSLKIETVDDLKKYAYNKQKDFAITLNGGVFSRKEIYYYSDTNTFDVFSGIDGTIANFTETEITDEFSNKTNIGKAMKLGGFYLMEEYEPKTCDNCGSYEGYNNSSGDFQCDNCGHDEGE